MEQSKTNYVLMLFVSTLLGAIGQILFKIGVVGGLYGFVIFVPIGLFAYFLSTIVYFYVLSRTHLSWAYGFGGMSYIFASLIAFFFLQEVVPGLRWVGIAVIAIGTALIGIS